MERALEVTIYANALMCFALAAVAVVQWVRQPAAATKWFAATFASLTAVALWQVAAPEEEGLAMELATKAVLIVLVLFPYFLYRFMGTFLHRPVWLEIWAAFLSIGLIVGAVLLPPFPEQNEGLSPVHAYYLLALIVHFSLLSLLVTVRLWLAGRGQPSVARTRMRLLSVGALGITTAVVLALSSIATNTPNPRLELTYQAIAFSSIVAFFFGFAPPAWLRVVWRRKEAEDLQRAITSLMAPRMPEEHAARLLPHVIHILGARGAALLDPQGEVIAAEGLSPEMMQELADASPDAFADVTHSPKLLVLPYEFGSLVVWASPYTPFFGREEVGLITSLGALTDVAMERATLFRSVALARGELEELNAALARRESMLAQAQDISQIGSWEWDISSDVLEWSDQLYRIYGVDPESFTPSFDRFLELIHPEDREYVESIVRQAVRDREGFQFEFRICQPSGDVRVLQTSGRFDLESSTTRLIGVAHDITERKESERALADAFSRERLARVGVERANQELEQFVYTVSHDLNSPLISVLGYIDLLEHDYASVLPAEARFYLERIKTSSGFMQSLIKDLLELSRVGRVQTEPDDVDLDALIEEITNEIKGRHPDIAVEVKADLPDIRMNPVRARQLFANLMQNSVKYAGRPDVRIEVSAKEGGNGLVTLSVADNGPGIASDHRERVFGVFERLDNQKEGTGIGLAVCKRIVETSGGRIWIADSESGTDVRLSVPASNGHGGTN